MEWGRGGEKTCHVAVYIFGMMTSFLSNHRWRFDHELKRGHPT